MIVDELLAHCGCECGCRCRCSCTCGGGTYDASIAAADTAVVVAQLANVNTLSDLRGTEGTEGPKRRRIVAIARAVGGGCGGCGGGGGPGGRALLYCLGADHLHGAVGGASLQHLQLFALCVLCAVRL